MRTFVLVSFWLGLVSFIAHIFNLSFGKWPSVRTVRIGEQVAHTLLVLAWVVWAAMVLWCGGQGSD